MQCPANFALLISCCGIDVLIRVAEFHRPLWTGSEPIQDTYEEALGPIHKMFRSFEEPTWNGWLEPVKLYGRQGSKNFEFPIRTEDRDVVFSAVLPPRLRPSSLERRMERAGAAEDSTEEIPPPLEWQYPPRGRGVPRNIPPAWFRLSSFLLLQPENNNTIIDRQLDAVPVREVELQDACTRQQQTCISKAKRM